MVKYKTASAAETQKLAKDLAGRVLSAPLSQGQGAFVFALKGDLGGGKTTFLQGFAKGLGIKEKILSPTFNIFKKYSLSKPGLVKPGLAWFYHFDCYRIEKSEEILALGFDEIISDPKNIVAIEWAEKIKDVLPKNTKWLNFEFVDENTRSIDIQ